MFQEKRETKKLLKTALNRPEGYLRDVANNSNVFTQRYYYITETSFTTLRDKYQKLRIEETRSMEDVTNELNKILKNPLFTTNHMIIGTKNSWDRFKEANATKAEQIKDRLIWVSDSLWYVKQELDDEFEKTVEDYLLKNKTIKSDWIPQNHDLDKLSFVPVNPFKQTIPITTTASGPPPAKKPPSFWGKVSSFWTAVSGPKVADDVFENRKAQCLKKGGYTWARQDSTVLTVNGREITFDNNTTSILPADERPTVKPGDRVTMGQVISDGDVDKPCQYLQVISGNNYCGACGCGVRTKAELDTKLRYKNVRCPRIPPLFTEDDESTDT